VSSGQQGVLIDEDSCGFADHVNEDDEKLKLHHPRGGSEEHSDYWRDQRIPTK
jgi:hypothetical protein